MLRPLTSTYLRILALSFLLGFPGVVTAEHLHDSTHEEEHCDVCEIAGPVSIEHSPLCTTSVPRPHEIQGKQDFIRLETYLFHKHQRGPPLLR
ncbi:MAG: hypothetical protein JJ957_08755 [Pseudomonadales bacterium]|nr:hypothetical protein [Pseudomonadales bacterium]MBO6596417.1 hypothetical protein [Pseudomonadales bacterium]MBO6822897.1 hypothetical protein [Pseudomonadales bacterium]